jgi:hypothetical protein
MEPTLKVPVAKLLKLKYDKLLSNFAFKFNLRRYTKGAYSMDGMTVDGAFNGTFGEALQLSGDVSFALPCVPGKPMVSGAVAFGFKGALGVAVAVVDGTASLEYLCHEGTLTMSGSAASVSFGPVVLTGVAVDFAFYGAGMKSFDAKISGVVDVKMLPAGALPDGGSLPTSSTPLSSVSLRVTETDGFVLDKLILAIGLDLRFTSESSGMVFAVTGELGFVYPCGDKEQAYGVAKLSAFVPGALAVTDFDLAVGDAQYIHLDPPKFQFHSSAAKPPKFRDKCYPTRYNRPNPPANSLPCYQTALVSALIPKKALRII